MNLIVLLNNITTIIILHKIFSSQNSQIENNNEIFERNVSSNENYNYITNYIISDRLNVYISNSEVNFVYIILKKILLSTIVNQFKFAFF